LKEEFVSGELLVKFRGDREAHVLRLTPGRQVWDAVREYRGRHDVVFAEPNYIARALFTPNDPYFKYQWDLDNPVYGGIHTKAAWDTGSGSGVTVAIVDTGIAYENYTNPANGKKYYQAPDLASTCFAQGYDYIENDTHPNDDNSHGTHVAGTVAQSTNNGVGVAGVAFSSCLMPVKVLDKNGSGSYAAVAAGIWFAADNGARVINLSLGGSASSQALLDAVAYAYNKGVTIIAAAGNDGVNQVSYPAAYDNYVIAVGATRYDETLSYYSNYGPSLDIVAPGGDTSLDQNGDGYVDGVLQNTFNPNTKNTGSFGYWFFQGTSMAAPHIAGIAALVIANGNATTPDKVRVALQETAEDKGVTGRDDVYGYGLVNAFTVLNWTAGPPDTGSPVITGATGNITGTTAELVTISATITDNVGVDNSTVYYTPINGTETAIAMTKEPDPSNVWKADTPVASNKIGTIIYYIKAKDAAGNEARDPSTGSYNITITDNDPPVANAGPDKSVIVNETVTLDGSGSTDNIGITNYSWDFKSDGIVDAATAVATSTYSALGTYIATLTVSDVAGNIASDTAAITVTEIPVEMTVFSDSFEVGEWNGLWTEDSQNDWFRSSQRAVDGTRSAEVDGRANDARLISIPIDLQGRSNARIEFSWLIESGLDTGEYLIFEVSTDGGTTWVEKSRLRGNVDPENVWHSPSFELSGLVNLRLRFKAKMSSSDEDANVDLVKVTAW